MTGLFHFMYRVLRKSRFLEIFCFLHVNHNNVASDFTTLRNKFYELWTDLLNNNKHSTYILQLKCNNIWFLQSISDSSIVKNKKKLICQQTSLMDSYYILRHKCRCYEKVFCGKILLCFWLFVTNISHTFYSYTAIIDAFYLSKTFH